jgi:hypothetical protein
LADEKLLKSAKPFYIIYLASDLDAAFAITVLLKFSIAEITSRSVWDVGGISRESPSPFTPTGFHAGNWKVSVK